MQVHFYTRPLPGPFADDAGPEPIHGRLTTDHAASSYGLPVVVADDGTVYGPAEVYDMSDAHGAAHLDGDRTAKREGWAVSPDAPDNAALVDAARRAGYVIQCPTYPAGV